MRKFRCNAFEPSYIYFVKSQTIAWVFLIWQAFLGRVVTDLMEHQGYI